MKWKGNPVYRGSKVLLLVVQPTIHKHKDHIGNLCKYPLQSEQTCIVFYILLTVHLDVILVNDQLDALFLNVFITCLYMFRTTSVHHQEDQVVLIHHLV